VGGEQGAVAEPGQGDAQEGTDGLLVVGHQHGRERWVQAIRDGSGRLNRVIRHRHLASLGSPLLQTQRPNETRFAGYEIVANVQYWTFRTSLVDYRPRLPMVDNPCRNNGGRASVGRRLSLGFLRFAGPARK